MLVSMLGQTFIAVYSHYILYLNYVTCVCLCVCLLMSIFMEYLHFDLLSNTDLLNDLGFFILH